MSARKAKSGRAGTGSTFDAFLKEEGLYEHAQALAIKRVIAWQIAQEMEKQSLSKVAMAGLMQTSRSQLDRLLDPDNDQVKLETLSRAARALGRKLKVALV
jgi:antitoxin HicB